MKKILIIILSLTLIFLSGCQNQSTPTQTAVIETAVPILEITQATPAFSLETIKNVEIEAPQAQKKVLLSNGKYEGGSGADYLMVEVLSQSIMGDLNGDGQQDAIVLLAENGGGSGIFVSLVGFLNNGSGFTQTEAVLIDDRPQINALIVSGSEVGVDALIHNENDSMVSPSLKVLETYQFYGNALTLIGLNETISGTERKIIIDFPTADLSVTDTLAVKGSMPVAPFENNLRYRFYDEAGYVLKEGAFAVNAADVGQPATFENVLSVPQVAANSKVRFELAELSMKDGSPLCMTSVEILMK
ncbi:MAG: Gmad2 immunoglobulin-like domain-containing protein [Anaerolineaceae bacterium]